MHARIETGRGLDKHDDVNINLPLHDTVWRILNLRLTQLRWVCVCVCVCVRFRVFKCLASTGDGKFAVHHTNKIDSL